MTVRPGLARRPAIRWRGLLCSLAAALAIGLAPAVADTPDPPPEVPSPETRAIEAAFLAGMAEAEAGRCDMAAERFQAILALDPTLDRVRLELALCQFRLGRDDEATANFREIYHGAVPVEVRQNIRPFLSALDRRRLFVPTFGLGLAPTTNANNATTARTIRLFGLDFDVAPEQRRRSGTGLATQLGGELRVPVDGNLRLLLGSGWQHRWYREPSFDDRFLVASIGLAYADATWDGSVRFLHGERSVGGQSVQHQTGGLVDIARAVTPTVSAAAVLQVAQLTHPERLRGADGWFAQALVGPRLTLDHLTQLQLIGGPIAQTAQEGFNDLQGWRGLAVLATDILPGAELVFYAGVTTLAARAPDPLFEVRRTGRDLEARLDATLRQVNVLGFSPTFGATWLRRSANISVFETEALEFRAGLRSAY